MPDKPKVFRPAPSLARTLPRPRPREARPTRQARGYDEAWRRLRAAVLAERPWCEECGAVATQVDHVKPKRRDQHACETDLSNLRSLCAPCHSRKTARSKRYG